MSSFFLPSVSTSLVWLLIGQHRDQRDLKEFSWWDSCLHYDDTPRMTATSSCKSPTCQNLSCLDAKQTRHRWGRNESLLTVLRSVNKACVWLLGHRFEPDPPPFNHSVCSASSVKESDSESPERVQMFSQPPQLFMRSTLSQRATACKPPPHWTWQMFAHPHLRQHRAAAGQTEQRWEINGLWGCVSGWGEGDSERCQVRVESLW